MFTYSNLVARLLIETIFILIIVDDYDDDNNNNNNSVYLNVGLKARRQLKISMIAK